VSSAGPILRFFCNTEIVGSEVQCIPRSQQQMFRFRGGEIKMCRGSQLDCGIAAV
jgi:hypothetical protein